MEKKTIREIFGAAAKDGRKVRKLTQFQMSRELNNYLPHDYTDCFYQEKLSRLERGDPKLTLTETDVIAVRDAFQLPDDIVAPILAELQSTVNQEPPQAETVRITIHEAGQLITKGTSSEFESYLGTYHCLFISTDSSSNVPVRGILEIVPGEGKFCQCTAYMTIQDKQGKDIKWYSGPFFINLHYRTWHCILVGSKRQEVCMLTASHFNSTIHPNLLNVAIALTTSSGIEKRPTMHRILISRKRIRNKETLELIQAQLCLNTDQICISKTALDALRADMEEKLQEAKTTKDFEKCQAVLTCIQQIVTLGKKEEYYIMDESIIYDTKSIIPDKRLRAFVVSKIRACADIMHYNKVSQTVQNICVDIIGGRK